VRGMGSLLKTHPDTVLWDVDFVINVYVRRRI
jgi:hypothetical protein